MNNVIDQIDKFIVEQQEFQKEFLQIPFAERTNPLHEEAIKRLNKFKTFFLDPSLLPKEILDRYLAINSEEANSKLTCQFRVKTMKLINDYDKLLKN